MRTLLKINLFGSIILICLVLSCKKKDKTIPDDPSKNNDFDRKAMLTSLGNNVIMPAYQALNAACIHLDSTVTDFNSNPDNVKFANLQAVFKTTYRTWQSASAFGFGPADEQYLSRNMNTFPADTTKINANISAGSYNLDAITNIDSKGLPAIDYLLFGGASDNAVLLSKFTTDNNASKRKQYLASLSSAMKANIAAVLNGWTAYMSTFVNATGTDVGSSLGQLINELDEDLEVLKNYKLGIPLGKQSMGTLFPAKVEAYYSGFSSELAVLHLKAMQNIYLGNYADVNGVGLDDYLTYTNAKYTSGTLNDAIKNQFTTAITKLQAMPDPLSLAITNNQTVVNAAYVEVQKLVVLLKTDMPSSLGVLITYEDNDGD